MTEKLETTMVKRRPDADTWALFRDTYTQQPTILAFLEKDML